MGGGVIREILGSGRLPKSLAANVEVAFGDRGVHASAQDGERGVATERREQDGSDVRSGGVMLLKAVRKDGECGRRGKKE
jgi:hypothetical protein